MNKIFTKIVKKSHPSIGMFSIEALKSQSHIELKSV